MTTPYLRQPLPLAEHQYAIIDRMRFPELPKEWPLIELVSPMLAPQAHIYPWLLPLHELKSRDWQQLMKELAQSTGLHSYPCSCLLLSSVSKPMILRNALVEALQFYDQQRNRHILRYYDPRVLFHLHWMLTPWQLSHQLPAKEVPNWTFWLQGEWRTLSFSEHIAHQPGEPQLLPLEQLHHIGLMNQVLAALPEPVRDMIHRQEISKKIILLLEQAMAFQLPTKEDQMAFVQHGLTQREVFWEAPKMVELLEIARTTPEFYRDETNGWDDAQWSEATQTRPHTKTWTY